MPTINSSNLKKIAQQGLRGLVLLLLFLAVNCNDSTISNNNPPSNPPTDNNITNNPPVENPPVENPPQISNPFVIAGEKTSEQLNYATGFTYGKVVIDNVKVPAALRDDYRITSAAIIATNPPNDKISETMMEP